MHLWKNCRNSPRVMGAMPDMRVSVLYLCAVSVSRSSVALDERTSKSKDAYGGTDARGRPVSAEARSGLRQRRGRDGVTCREVARGDSAALLVKSIKPATPSHIAFLSVSLSTSFLSSHTTVHFRSWFVFIFLILRYHVLASRTVGFSSSCCSFICKLWCTSPSHHIGSLAWVPSDFQGPSL